jgi:threonine dehydrogenase-like Zn-dependent dehydrogenase
MGITAPGGMQQVIAAPTANVHPLPAGISADIGSLSEPVAVCVRALYRAQTPMGSRVVILGSGTIGLISILLAAPAAREVVVTARYPHQAQLAREFGATEVFAPGSAELLDWARANPVDLVIETVGGAADTLAEAINVVRGGGTVVPLGVFTADVMVPARKLVNQEVRVVGSVVYGHEGHQSEFGAAVGLLPRLAEKLALLKSATYPLEQAHAAFEHALDKSRSAVKVSVSVAG